jgi:hypothetical protein
VVGQMIAEKCSPVAFSNGVLFIWVVNAAWMNQLFFARRELLKKINEYEGGWVKQIRFTQDRKDVPTTAECLPDQPGDPEFESPSASVAPQRDQ